MEIEFRGQYSKSILHKGVALINKPSLRSTVFRIILFVGFFLLYISLAVSVFQDESRTTFEIGRLVRHLFTILLLGYIALQAYISAYITASRLWKAPAMQKPIAGKVSSQWITLYSSKSEANMGWEKFAKVAKAEEMVVMLIPNGFPLILPQEFFGNGNDWHRFQQIVDYKTRPAK